MWLTNIADMRTEEAYFVIYITSAKSQILTFLGMIEVLQFETSIVCQIVETTSCESETVIQEVWIALIFGSGYLYSE